jgi:hypothetical protein
VERAVPTSKTSPLNVPSTDEAHRVVSFILDDEAMAIAVRVAAGTPTADNLRELLALTIAVVAATEKLYRATGHGHPEQWESFERSAQRFTDQWLAGNDREVKQVITTHRRRKLAARAGVLRLVESDRNKQARWAAITLPHDAPTPIAEDVREGFGEAMLEAEERVTQHLAAVASTDQLALAGQVVGLLCASEFLLALFPSNEVAAFCVQLGSMTAELVGRDG